MKLNELFSHWNQVHTGTLAVIEKFNDDELSYIAYDGAMPVGRIALHIADAEEGWFRLGITRERQDWPSDYTLENYPSKEAIKTLLSEVHAKTMAYLGSLSSADLDAEIETSWGTFSTKFIIWHVIEHEIHHRGELSLILGTFGREGLDV